MSLGSTASRGDTRASDDIGSSSADCTLLQVHPLLPLVMCRYKGETGWNWGFRRLAALILQNLQEADSAPSYFAEERTKAQRYSPVCRSQSNGSATQDMDLTSTTPVSSYHTTVSRIFSRCPAPISPEPRGVGCVYEADLIGIQRALVHLIKQF